MKHASLIVLILTFSGLPVNAQVTFTDITQTAGVANSLGNQSRLSTNLAWGDYDGDGNLDLYVTNWGSSVSQSENRLYKNSGNSTFTDVARTAGVSDGAFRNSIDAHFVDYDNDGDLDLYISEFFSQDQLYQNNGNGSFSNVTRSAGVNVISQGDEASASWADYDNDGNIDLYVCKIRFRNSLYHNNGNGSFSEVGVSSGVADTRDSQAADWGDYDGDGDLDLYVVNREQNNNLFQNDGQSFFTEVACSASLDNIDVGRNAYWVDSDNDNDLDLFVANIGANALYRNDGNSTFTNVSQGDLKSISGAWVSWDGAWGDFDGDGNIDLFVANGAESRSGQLSPLLQNTGNNAFANITTPAGLNTTTTSGIAVGAADFDGDGDLDLYLVNSRFPSFDANQLFQNNTRP